MRPLRSLALLACGVVLMTVDPHGHWQGAHDTAILALGFGLGLLLWSAHDLWTGK